jgi:hypothetical protein
MAFFASGFFPYKKVLHGLAQKTTLEDYVQLGLAPMTPPPAPFDRLVFVVIDALRRFSCLPSPDGGGGGIEDSRAG